MLSEVADAERGRELSTCKLRVVDANSVLKAAFVVVDGARAARETESP